MAQLRVVVVLGFVLGFVLGCGDEETGSNTTTSNSGSAATSNAVMTGSNSTSGDDTTTGSNNTLDTSNGSNEQEEEIRDWDGADVPVMCESETMAIRGEFGPERTLLHQNLDSYGLFGNGRTWRVDGEGVRGFWIRLFVESNSNSVEKASGFWRFHHEDPILCATRGTTVARVAGSSLQIELRSLKRLGLCPGSTPIEGAIEGCFGEGCVAQAPGMEFDGDEVFGPGGGGDVHGHVLEITFADPAQRTASTFIYLPREPTDDGSTRLGEPEGAFVYTSAGAVYCAGTVSLTTSDNVLSAFKLADLTYLGECESAEAVDGYLNVCLD